MHLWHYFWINSHNSRRVDPSCIYLSVSWILEKTLSVSCDTLYYYAYYNSPREMLLISSDTFSLNCSLASPVIALMGGNLLPWRPHSCQISASQTLNTSRYKHHDPLNKIHTRGEPAHPRIIKVGGVGLKGFKFKHIYFLKKLKIKWQIKICLRLRDWKTCTD